MIEKLKSAPRAWATAAAIAVVCITGATLALSGTANAAISTYHGTATSGTIKLATGSASARVITNPPVVLDATLDDAAGTISPTATFTPVYTPTFAGPFELQLYVRADINQAAAASGPWNPATGAFSVSAPYRFAVTVFNQAGAAQAPATDSKITDPATCFVDITLDFTGTANLATGAVTVVDSQFDIPAFPAGCGLAQDELNNQLNGPNNSVDLVFAGSVTTTTSTSTTSTSTSTTTTTAPTTTSSTTTTTAPTTTSSTTTTTAPTTTSSTSTSTSVPATTSTTTSTSVPSTTSTSTTVISVPSTSTTSTSIPGTTVPGSTLPPRDPSTTTPHPPTVPGIPGTSPVSTTSTVPGTTTSTTVAPTTTVEGGSASTTVPTTTAPENGSIPEATVSVGETVNLSGSGCDAGATVTVTLDDGSTLGTTTADETGAFTLSGIVPANLAPGDYLATASCDGTSTRSKVRDAQFGAMESTGGVVKQFLRLHVVAPEVVPSTPAVAPSAPAHQLARTGSSSGPLAAIGLGIVMLGGAFVYGSRRTRTIR